MEKGFFPGSTGVKNLPINAGNAREVFYSWVAKIPWSRKRQPAPVFLPRKSLGQRSLEGYSPRGRKELDTTEQPSMHTHTSWKVRHGSILMKRPLHVSTARSSFWGPRSTPHNSLWKFGNGFGSKSRPMSLERETYPGKANALHDIVVQQVFLLGTGVTTRGKGTWESQLQRHGTAEAEE